MKKRTKHRRKRSRKPIAQQVLDMAASGLVEDEIALRLGIDKNTLRAKHIGDVKLGRAIAMARAGESDDLTREEMHAADAILSAIDSKWQTPDGNLLWPGLDGEGARSAADAFARWQLDGGKFICAGLSQLDRDRVVELCRIKVEAEALLMQRARCHPRPIIED